MPQRRSPKGQGMVALPGKSGISRAVSRSWREPCRNGRLCSLTRLGLLHPPGPRPREGVPSPASNVEMGHYRRNCPRNSVAKETGNTGEDEGRPQRSRGPFPQTKGADEQQPGTGDRAPRGHRMVRVLTPERNEPTATPQDPMVFAPICPDCESDPPDLDSAGF